MYDVHSQQKLVTPHTLNVLCHQDKNAKMKFVIFDIDGTLTNTKQVDDKCFMEAFEQTFKIEIWNQKWENLKNVTDWGITEEIVQREWGRRPKNDEYELMISNFISNLEAEMVNDKLQFNEVAGARDLFIELKGHKEFNLGIATGAWEKSAKLKLETIGIDVDGICFSNSNYYKSREAITKDVVNQLTTKTQKLPDQIIYFGDGEWDYKTCQLLGMEFLGIDIEGDGKLRKLGAKTVYRDYTNRDQILNELKKGGTEH